MITSGETYLCVGPIPVKLYVSHVFEWATDRFTKVTYQNVHGECRYIDTRVFTFENLLKEDIPKGPSWFVLRIYEGGMYAMLTEIRVTEGTIISYPDWEELLRGVRLSEIPEVRKYPVVEYLTW